MWTAQNRRRYDRSQLRYSSDLTDDEWAHVAPLIPPAKRGGNKRSVDVRKVMNGIMYVLSTGCQWRAVPKDVPPRSMLFDYLNLWSYDGTLDRIHHALYKSTGRPPGPLYWPWITDRLLGRFSFLTLRGTIVRSAYRVEDADAETEQYGIRHLKSAPLTPYRVACQNRRS
jgi:transposase